MLVTHPLLCAFITKNDLTLYLQIRRIKVYYICYSFILFINNVTLVAIPFMDGNSCVYLSTASYFLYLQRKRGIAEWKNV